MKITLNKSLVYSKNNKNKMKILKNNNNHKKKVLKNKIRTLLNIKIIKNSKIIRKVVNLILS